MSRCRAARRFVSVLVAVVALLGPAATLAAPEGTLTFGFYMSPFEDLKLKRP